MVDASSIALLRVHEKKFYDVFTGESREDNARLTCFYSGIHL